MEPNMASDSADLGIPAVEKLLYQGAEARVYLGHFLSRPVVVKQRLSKSYRVPQLDQRILKQRLGNEIRCMTRCRRAGVLTPCIYMIDTVKHLIYMEFIDGQTVNAFIQSCGDHAMRCKVARDVGAALGHMHNAGVVHGDLTTSNIMLKPAAEAPTGMRVVIIDFGLASTLPSVEDKAVDLYVLERAFVSSHPGCEALIHEVLDAYRFAHKDGAAVLLRLEQVRLRGRKRDMVG